MTEKTLDRRKRMTEQPGIGAWIILVVTILASAGLTLGVMWPSMKTKSSVLPDEAEKSISPEMKVDGGEKPHGQTLAQEE